MLLSFIFYLNHDSQDLRIDRIKNRLSNLGNLLILKIPVQDNPRQKHQNHQSTQVSNCP